MEVPVLLPRAHGSVSSTAMCMAGPPALHEVAHLLGTSEQELEEQTAPLFAVCPALSRMSLTLIAASTEGQGGRPLSLVRSLGACPVVPGTVGGGTGAEDCVSWLCFNLEACCPDLFS